MLLTFRLDRNAYRGGVFIFIREDVPSKELRTDQSENKLEGIFIEVNIHNISMFCVSLSKALYDLISKYENLITLGDFNSRIDGPCMKDLCDVYGLKNSVSGDTCFKSILNPSSIDLILINKSKCFLSGINVETGLMDHHVTALRSFFSKKSPILINDHNLKGLDQTTFKADLSRKLGSINNIEIILNQLLWKYSANKPQLNKNILEQIIHLL